MQPIRFRKIIACAIPSLIFGAFINSGFGQPFQATYQFSGGFDIRGYLPVPQTDGFDYYFTPASTDSSIVGKDCTITSVSVSTFGTNLGDVVNWDLEMYLGPAPFGLPSGQFTQTLVDPVAGYTRTAPTQFALTFGDMATTQSYEFNASYNYQTQSVSATPFYSDLKTAFTSSYDLSNGLYAQLFVWTADNTNSWMDFGGVTLVVNGNVVPEPSSAVLCFLAIGGVGLYRRKTRRRRLEA